MPKLKAKEDINITLLGTLKSGSVIDNISTDEKTISFKNTDGSSITFGKNDYISKFVGVPDNTPENISFEKSAPVEILDNTVKTFGKSLQVGGAIGTLAGLGIGFYRKSGVSGYIGYAVLFGIVGAVIGGYIGGKKAVEKMKQ